MSTYNIKKTDEMASLSAKTNGRSERLKEVYEYAKKTINGIKSVTSFANYIGKPQKTTDVYIKGESVPSEGFLMAVVEKMPEFNLEWLIKGEGYKYNPKYLVITNENDPDYNEPEEDRIKRLNETSGSKDVGFMMYLSSLKRRIMKAIECPTQDELKQRLLDIVEELEDTGK